MRPGSRAIAEEVELRANPHLIANGDRCVRLDSQVAYGQGCGSKAALAVVGLAGGRLTSQKHLRRTFGDVIAPIEGPFSSWGGAR
jgi:hypothetical protein